MEIRYWIDNWINECFLQKQRRKVRCHPLSSVTNSVSEKYIEWVSENQKADIQEEYYRLQNHITFMEFNKKVKEEVNPFRKNLQRILHENSHNKLSCKELFDTLHTMVKRNYGLMNHDVISFILFFAISEFIPTSSPYIYNPSQVMKKHVIPSLTGSTHLVGHFHILIR